MKNPTEKDKKSITHFHSYAETLREVSLLFEEKVEELSLLRRVGDIVGHIFNQEIFFRKFVDILLDETNAENCSFMLMDDDTDRLVIKMARGRNDDGSFFDHPTELLSTFHVGEGIAGNSHTEDFSRAPFPGGNSVF